MNIVAAAPSQFSDCDKALLKALVERGGEVSTAALATNINSAKALVLGTTGGKLKGVAALKKPQASYRKRVGSKAGAEIDEASYPYELGYVFVSPDVQGSGLSHRLVAAALKEAGAAAVFATTRVDNDRMLATLGRAGFRQLGDDYRGRGTRMIRLLVRPAR